MSDAFPDFVWTIRRGTLEYRDFAVTTDGVATDLTGYTQWFTVKRRLADADAAAVFQLTNGSGITVVSAIGGTGTLTVLPAHTAGLANVRQKFYAEHVGQSPSGQVFPLESGVVIVLPSVKDPL
jgi:hypothetical protein